MNPNSVENTFAPKSPFERRPEINQFLPEIPNRRLRSTAGRYKPPSFEPVVTAQPVASNSSQQSSGNEQSAAKTDEATISGSAVQIVERHASKTSSNKSSTKKKRTCGFKFADFSLTLQRGVQWAMSWYGYFIGRFPYIALMIGLGIGFGCSTGLMRLNLIPLRDNDFMDPSSKIDADRNFIYYFSRDGCHNEVCQGRVTRRPRTLASNTISSIASTRAVSNVTITEATTMVRRSRRRRTTTLPSVVTTAPTTIQIAITTTALKTTLAANTTAGKPTTTPKPVSRYACYNKNNMGKDCRCLGMYVAFIYIGCKDDTCKKAKDHAFLDINMFDRLLYVNSQIQYALTPDKDHRDFTIGELCGRAGDNRNGSLPCSEFNVQTVNTTEVRTLLKLSKALTFPYIDNTKVLSQVAGDVKLTENENGDIYATSVSVLQQSYSYCVAKDDESGRVLDIWLNNLDRQMALKNRNEFQPLGIKVVWSVPDRIAGYSERELYALLPKFGATIVAVAVWAVAAMSASDIVTSKPWLGVIGIASTFLANAAGIGFMTYLGYPFSYACAGVPFLILAIGLDDMFVVVTGLRRTTPDMPRRQRMRRTMHEAGTAILITAVTNIVAEGIGSKTPYQIISLFTLYTLVLMVFDFVLQITIFASALSFFAMAEPKGRNSCCCCAKMPVRTRHVLVERSVCYILCCAVNAKSVRNYAALRRLHPDEDEEVIVGQEEANLENAENGSSNEEHGHANEAGAGNNVQAEYNEATFLKHEEEESSAESALKRLAYAYSYIVIETPMRYITCVLFIGYIAFCSYGVLTVRYGMRLQNLAPFDSAEYKLSEAIDEPFHGYREVHVYFQDYNNYSDPAVQQDIESIFRKLETSGYFHHSKKMTRWWLREYLDYLNEDEDRLTRATNDTDVFYDILYDEWAKERNREWLLKDDVVSCVTNRGVICKTRGHVIAIDMTSNSRQVAAWTFVNNLRDQYAKYKLMIYDGEYGEYEMKRNTIYITIYYILITVASAIAVAVLMVPHIILIFYILVMLFSEVLGLIGTMPFCGMDMDLITLTMLIINVGYSVDFVMHMSYDYMIAPGKTRSEKVVHALTDVAHALLPAGSGTVMSVLAMATTGIYIYYVYFASLAIAVGISALHAILFFPVFLSFLGPIDKDMVEGGGERQNSSEKTETNDEKQTTNTEESKETADTESPVKVESPMELVATMASRSVFPHRHSLIDAKSGQLLSNVIFTPPGTASAHIDRERRMARQKLTQQPTLNEAIGEVEENNEQDEDDEIQRTIMAREAQIRQMVSRNQAADSNRDSSYDQIHTPNPNSTRELQQLARNLAKKPRDSQQPSSPDHLPQNNHHQRNHRRRNNNHSERP